MDLIIISAPWCAPCHSMQAKLSEAGIPFTAIDIEKNPEYVDLYSIQSVPVLIFKEADKEHIHIGTLSIKQIMQKLGHATN